MFNIQQISNDQLLSKLRDIENPFTFTRWGDGEWGAILQKHAASAKNCDGHPYYPEMGVQLLDVLKDKPGYWLGMQNLAMRMYEKRILQLLEYHKLTELKWVPADMFHHMAIKGKLDDILQVVNSRKVVLIAPDYLRELKPSHITYDRFVSIPSQRTFLDVADIVCRATEVLQSMGNQPVLVCISASLPAGIICHQLSKLFGDKHTIIDFGSLWDPLVGKYSRSYMRDMKPRQI